MVLWTDIKIIKVTKELPDRLFYTTVKTSKLSLKNIDLNSVSLCKGKLIPDTCHHFYKNLKVSKINT